MSLAIIAALATAVFIFGAVAYYTRPQKQSTQESAQEPVEYYGHPWAPVPAIRRRLPDLPAPYAWETWVEGCARSGDYFLHMRITNLLTEERFSATRQFNLTSTYDGSWEAHYDKYSSIHKDIWRRDVIGKNIDWANAQARKVVATTVEPGPTDYKLGK